MSQQFWQDKLWGLLHRSKWTNLNACESGYQAGFWHDFQCMQDWQPPVSFDESKKDFWLNSQKLPRTINPSIQNLVSLDRGCIPEEILNCVDPRQVFWWFWRCYPDIVASRNLRQEMSSTEWCQTAHWNDASITATLTSAKTGYLNPLNSTEHLTEHSTQQQQNQSRPYLTLFHFSPIQAFIQNSCTLEEVWAGAWLLHYLAAKICWKIACKYGPDTLLSPSLYADPLIDDWLLQRYPNFAQWLQASSQSTQLRASFPNQLIMILPDNGCGLKTVKGHPIWATLIHAEQTLKQEWLAIGQQVLRFLQNHNSAWNRIDLNLWHRGLESQWQSCWVALPVDRENIPSSCQSSPQASIVAQAQTYLNYAKQTHTWKIPTVFGSRSTRSDQGAAIRSIYHSDQPSTESQINQLWQPPLFHLEEQLNVTEVVQQTLPHIVPELLFKTNDSLIDRRITKALPDTSHWSVFVLAQNHLQVFQSEQPEAELAAQVAFHRSLHDFSNYLAPYLTEQRHGGRLLYAKSNEILAAVPLQQWDSWLWDIHQCFKGANDPALERLQLEPEQLLQKPYFKQEGTYWCWQGTPDLLPQRPLLTPGSKTVLQFQVVIAHHSVPLSIALAHLRTMEQRLEQQRMRQHQTIQVQILSSENEPFIATALLETFTLWRSIVQSSHPFKPILLEQLAHFWSNSPSCCQELDIQMKEFCDRYTFFRYNPESKYIFEAVVFQFLQHLYKDKRLSSFSLSNSFPLEVQNWLDLAVFLLRQR